MRAGRRLDVGRKSRAKDARHHPELHQFDKSRASSTARRARAEGLRAAAGLAAVRHASECPYRVIDVAAGDLTAVGRPQVRLQAWIPAQGLSRADVDVELHHLSGAPVGDPLPGCQRQTQIMATLSGTLAAPIGWFAIWNHQRHDGVGGPGHWFPFVGVEVLEPVA